MPHQEATDHELDRRSALRATHWGTFRTPAGETPQPVSRGPDPATSLPIQSIHSPDAPDLVLVPPVGAGTPRLTDRDGDTVCGEAPESLRPESLPEMAGEVPPGPDATALYERSSDEAEPLDDVVRMWLRQVGRTPLLRLEDEVLLAKRIERGVRAARDLHKLDSSMSGEQRAHLISLVELGHSARERLTSANLRLVIAVAKRFLGRGLTFGDLIQEGNLGLLRAVEKFDYRRGFRFSTYATWWIRQAIARAIADQGRTIRVPVHMVEWMNRVLRAQSSLAQVLGRDPTVEEIAEHVGLSV